ncbi:hypothetical protein PENANT_c077G06753 [Penicillium antarcticum]|uniref:Zn(2)-C6 fungal-type domain-containing protein n=1 Tax=Penicillium antarcticum TaxID=416450 RepID=A0A1V6PP85_9EURO|nr:uncharacterized protein N7508_005252 [Penicillium antarcticum]KAJ5306237.1 hypothetical protein N7508_005252 [Penicillium antarcticum]OQD78840.1 hypothetical protein PENANT_c077G06753 [Penicillium antarcticum]
MEQERRKDGKAPVRSHHGCTNCRRSKVKCDEQKPSCTRCWQKDLQCSSNYQLKWESDYRYRGVAFGRSGRWGKNSSENRQTPSPTGSSPAFPEEAIWLVTPRVDTWAFLNNDMSLIQRLCDEEENHTEPYLLPAFNAKMVIGEQGPRGPRPLSASSPLPYIQQSLEMDETLTQHLPSSLSLFPSLDSLGNRVLFDYYINQVCPRTVHSPNSKSPFASVILPYCVSASPTVLRAIQALAACHWSQYDPQYSNISLQLKSRVLNDFRKRINLNPTSIFAEDPEILVIVLFLCLFDIVDDCDKQWIVHLQGAKDIIRLRRRQQRLLTEKNETESQCIPQDPVSSFTELFFAFQDVMGRTACAKADLFGPSYWHEDDTTINPWMGCSPALVSIIFAVMDLSRSRRLMVSDEDQMSFSTQAAALSNKLDTLRQESHTGEEEDLTIHKIAELKRLTGIVYLKCALYGAHPAEDTIKTYIRMILKDVIELLALESACHVIWPLFVAAVELDPLDFELWIDPETGSVTDGRRLVLGLLARMAKNSVSSVSRTRAVIEQVWKSRDFDLLKSFKQKKASIAALNDWERYVVPLSDALSLV